MSLTRRAALAGCGGGLAMLTRLPAVSRPAFAQPALAQAALGVVAPAGVPPAIVDPLAAQIAKLMADPITREKLTTIALEPLASSTPDSFAAFIKTEVDRWAGIVKNSGAEPE